MNHEEGEGSSLKPPFLPRQDPLAANKQRMVRNLITMTMHLHLHHAMTTVGGNTTQDSLLPMLPFLLVAGLDTLQKVNGKGAPPIGRIPVLGFLKLPLKRSVYPVLHFHPAWARPPLPNHLFITFFKVWGGGVKPMFLQIFMKMKNRKFGRGGLLLMSQCYNNFCEHFYSITTTLKANILIFSSVSTSPDVLF